jgi:hypothetical protein
VRGFLLDEHLSSNFRRELARRVSVEVWTVGDAGAPDIGTPDFALLRWCEDNDFVLVTEDRRTMPGHVEEHVARGRHVPGVLVLRPGTWFRERLEWLELVAGATSPEEVRDLVLYSPPDS